MSCVYKVTRATRVDEELLITSFAKPYLHVYHPGSWEKCHLGPFLAFETEAQAMDYVTGYISGFAPASRRFAQGVQVWECETRGKVGYAYRLVDWSVILGTNEDYKNEVKRFWSQEKPYPLALTMRPPEGTVAVDELKLTKLIYCYTKRVLP